MTPESTEQKWYAIEIMAVPAAAEAVEFAFDLLNSLGTETDHLKKDPTEDLRIVGYFDDLPDDETLQAQLANALSAYDLTPESIRSSRSMEIENRDWLAEWKKHWKPTVVGRFVVAPPWEDVSEASDKIVIKIEPNMAFGTGTHETTRLCLAEIERLYQPGDSVLDVGTGTGLLAIAAAKRATQFGPETSSRILACDTDSDSVKIAVENAELNGVGDKIEFYQGSIAEETETFDLVLANLTIDVILPILHLLLSSTRRQLVMSGILAEQRPLIETALNESGYGQFSIEELGEWISVTVETN